MAQALRALPPILGTWTEFLVLGFSPASALAVTDILGVNQGMGALSHALTLSSVCMCMSASQTNI